jgi:hypothetical protein
MNREKMTRKLTNWMLMAALVVGLGMNVTSCKDDDDENNNERTPEEIAQDPYEKESEAADALYRLVSQLSVCDSLPNNWKTATFEPKAGKVLDQSQPRVRTIAVNNAAEAVARYNSLTGKDLPATTTSDTYTVKDVGTLQLNVGGAGTIATIDVDVKQMPQLAQLRLVSAADMGENGHFSGEPYYSFGDVVRDNDGCYWICVRPAYSPNGKEDTHWMSFHLIDKNIKTYTRKGCQEQKYPVDLGVNKEKMQYLAELMAIMANPMGYKDAAKQGNYFGITGLGGLQEAAMPVDSLVKQAKLWNENKIWEKIMPVGYSKDKASSFRQFFKTDYVNFIYEKGSTSGTNLTIKYAQYKDASHFYKNEPEYKKAIFDMKDNAFDITQSYTTLGLSKNVNDLLSEGFVVRYKSGYQLSSNWVFSPSATDSIPGVTTVHRFNACKDIIFDNMSYTKAEVRPRMIMAKDGKFYKSEAACTANHTAPVALVVYISGNAEASGNYGALAMSFAKVSGVLWDDVPNERDTVCIESTSENRKVWETQNNGISRTEKLYRDGHNHQAAEIAWEYNVEGFDPAAYGYSHWFLPTAGQAIMAVKGLGGQAGYNNFWTVSLSSNLNNELKAAGINTFDIECNCWTSTEDDMEKAVHFNPLKTGIVYITSYDKTETIDVRPFIAF